MRYLTVQEVADRLRVSSQVVREWIKKGKLMAVRPSDRVIRVPVSELARLESAVVGVGS